MIKPNTNKWADKNTCEGLLYFAQSLCEALDDHSLDSYKAPALNLHLCFLELSALINLFYLGRIKKGSLSFSISECKKRISSNIIFKEKTTQILSRYISEIETRIEHKEEEINKQKLVSIISAATSDINSSYWESLKSEVAKKCQTGTNKKDIKNLCLELATEIELLGFSKQYAHAKTKKFFFSDAVEPKEINNPMQIKDFLSIFDEQVSEWEVLFIGNNADHEISKYMEYFDLSSIKRRPQRFANETKYKKFASLKKKNEIIISVNNVKAPDPHAAREQAQKILNFYTDVCRFHRHNADFNFHDDSFVFQKNIKKYYIIPKPPKPMECGMTFRKAENDEAIQCTMEILSGGHFTNDSIRTFQKILDFHHAAIMSSDLENQLLDLWAALEGFLPAPDGRSDRISWYLSYLLPPLTLMYNEKIFQALALDLKNESQEINDMISNLQYSSDFVINTVCIVTSSDLSDQRNELLSLISENPLLRNRVDTISKSYHSTKTIRKSINDHRDRLSWHIQRIYTQRNQIAHNASSLPYVRSLVENLHDYLDTLLLCTSLIGKKFDTVVNIHTALEKISIIEADYLQSLSGDINIDSNNCIDTIFGFNNCLCNFIQISTNHNTF